MENSPYVVAHRGIFMEMFEQASFILVDQFVHTYVQISIYVCMWSWQLFTRFKISTNFTGAVVAVMHVEHYFILICVVEVKVGVLEGERNLDYRGARGRRNS